jgi:hypothetical protein
MPHSIKRYTGQSRVFKLAFPKYSSVRYFRNANGLFLIGVGGYTPENFLPASHGLPHFVSVEGYKGSRDISVGIATGYRLDCSWQEQDIFLLSIASRPGIGWTLDNEGSFPGVKLTTYFHVVLTLRMCGAMPPLYIRLHGMYLI